MARWSTQWRAAAISVERGSTGRRGCNRAAKKPPGLDACLLPRARLSLLRHAGIRISKRGHRRPLHKPGRVTWDVTDGGEDAGGGWCDVHYAFQVETRQRRGPPISACSPVSLPENHAEEIRLPPDILPVARFGEMVAPQDDGGGKLTSGSGSLGWCVEASGGGTPGDEDVRGPSAYFR